MRLLSPAQCETIARLLAFHITFYFLTVLASIETADCANALPSSVAPVFSTIAV
jgi:hypothetical protein